MSCYQIETTRRNVGSDEYVVLRLAKPIQRILNNNIQPDFNPCFLNLRFVFSISDSLLGVLATSYRRASNRLEIATPLLLFENELKRTKQKTKSMTFKSLAS